MRFTRLVVDSFQAIRRIDVEFGPGLNVLYGSNDLGKSTVATAIRAALLVPPTSSEAAIFTPWYADATPRVSLTLVDDSGHYWRVKKGFGSGTNSGAELEHSKDGTAFTLDCKGRQVEEKLRTLLAWGIPAPGGKGAPRGLPSSFLANVLLAAQTDVDAILGKSLAADLDGSGKLRLTKALATLAQDPVFKKVLDAAQREVDLCFTPTGRRKRGQTSKFTEATSIVKQLQEQLTSLQRQLAESSGIEQNVRALRERRAHAVVRVHDATAALSTVHQRLQNKQAREEGRARLQAAQIALAEIEKHAIGVKALTTEVETAAARVKTQEEDVSRAGIACDAEDTALGAAEEAHRIATSEDGARQRELRRAQLAERAAALGAKKQATEARKAKADAAVTARANAEEARSAVQSARAEHEKISRELASSRERAAKAETDVELARAVVAYGRWRDASSAADDAKRATEAAAKNRRDAQEKDAEATSLDTRARTIEEELSTRQATLPTEEQAKAIEQLERDLKLAEAALGGGISVAVRPRAGVAVRALVDQAEIDEPNLSTERVLEAERSVRLFVGELVEIEVTAGAADKRRTVETIRTRWTAEAAPMLDRAAVKSPQDIVSALAAIARERLAAAEVRRSAGQLRAEAKNLREQAAIHEEQAAKLAANVVDLETRKAALGGTDVKILEAYFSKLGKAWESEAEARHSSKLNELKTQHAQLATTEQHVQMAEYLASEAEKRARDLGAALDAALAALESPDPDELQRSIDEELACLSREEAENAAKLSSLVAEASNQVKEAANAVDAAREGVRSAKERHSRAVSELEVARAHLNATIGKQNALSSQLEGMDRTGAEELVKLRERELAALPNEQTVSAADVEAADKELANANREMEEAKEELHKSEGALSKVGGAAVREEVERVEEALKAARIRETDLEVEAEAWKLLFDTLRDVENDEGAHLGRALAGPLTTKFLELTGGRYQGLRLDAMLKTEAIEVATPVANGPDVLDALSVGTRAQLATLIRLTIADQLKSAIVLDDHLVHTDPTRLAWFRDVLMKTTPNTQVIVFTCRPDDYLAKEELPVGAAVRDLAGGAVRAVDVARVMKRWAVVPSLPVYPVDQPLVTRATLTIVDSVGETERFRDALPVYDLAAAAGAFSASQAPEVIGWARVKTTHPLDRSMFAARVAGESMEPGVSDGAWAIFRAFPAGAAPPPTALDGRRVIVQLRDKDDPETGGRYTFKRWRVTRFSAEGGVEEVELRADNPAYQARSFTASDGELRVVAEFVGTVT